MFNWQACAVAVFLYWMTTGLGISMGYHRLHTHRSYHVPLALEYFFAVCGTLRIRRASSESPEEASLLRKASGLWLRIVAIVKIQGTTMRN